MSTFIGLCILLVGVAMFVGLVFMAVRLQQPERPSPVARSAERQNVAIPIARPVESALIDCEDCGSQVSRRATSCPRCGAPIIHAGFNPRPRTIEQTSKEWKLGMLLGFSAAAFGMLLGCAGVELGWFIFILGSLTFVGSRVGAWWNHG